MKVIVAKTAGFCWGVRRAMDAALEAAVRFRHRGPVRTLGPLIHNPQALAHLTQCGVQIATSIDEAHDGTIVVRAHGVPMPDYQALKARRDAGHLRLCNATCPEVAKVQSTIRQYSHKGYFIIILGQIEHPEVIAHRSFAASGHAVVADLTEAQALPTECLSKTLVVAQTTFNIHAFHEIAHHFKMQKGHIIIRNTICRDTWERQDEARKIAMAVDAMVVVGGRSSNNTRHLMEMVHLMGTPVYLVESYAELDHEGLRHYETLGVLAGASTPTWTVDEVVEALHNASSTRPILRLARRYARIFQLPYATAWGLLTFFLHRSLQWHTGWMGPVLPVTFTLGFCAILPFLDSRGLGAKGLVREAFLMKHRAAIHVTGAVALALTLFIAIHLGTWVLIGTAGVGAIGLFYPQSSKLLGKRMDLRRFPAAKDLSQALAPALLSIALPWLQGFPASPLPVGVAFLAIFSLGLAAHAERHTREFQEDRIIERETLPVALGLKLTRVLTMSSLGVGVMLLFWIFK